MGVKMKVLDLHLCETNKESNPRYVLTFICPKTNESKKYGIIFKFSTLAEKKLYNCRDRAISIFTKMVRKNLPQNYRINLKEIKNET